MHFMYLLPFGLLSLGIIILDFVSKKLVLNTMTLGQSIPLWKDVFHLTFVKNEGASFGMLKGGRWFFIIITIALISYIIYYILKEKERNKLFLLAASFIIGGGIGNMIDRLMTGKVVDFFDFCLINFAIFNVADCFVVVGAILMIIYFLITEIKGKKNGRS